jgi:hypothetical protein
MRRLLMTRFDSLAPVLALICGLLTATTARAADEALEAYIAKLNVPPGLEIDIFAEVPRTRSLAWDSASGAIAVGTWSGKVYGVGDQDGDGAADAVARCSRASRSRMAWRFTTGTSMSPSSTGSCAIPPRGSRPAVRSTPRPR